MSSVSPTPAARRLVLLVASAALFATVPLRAAAAATPTAKSLSPGDTQFFETKIRPILADKCYKCHSRDSEKVKGGLMLDTSEALLHGGNTGPAIVPGKPN